MNALFEFYAALDGQADELHRAHYADDYSLRSWDRKEGFGLGRQAVYDNIKRTEKILEDYEWGNSICIPVTLYAADFDGISERYPEDICKSRLGNFIKQWQSGWLWAVSSFIPYPANY